MIVNGLGFYFSLLDAYWCAKEQNVIVKTWTL